MKPLVDGASWPGSCRTRRDHYSSWHGSKIRRLLSLSLADERDVVAGVLRAGGAIWRTAHSRAHRFVPVSLSLFLSSRSFPILPHVAFFFPCSFSLGLSLSLSLSLSPISLSVEHVLLRSAGSFVHGSAASSATSGPSDEEGPSGPIYPRASCDDPVDGFQKYTEAVLN